VPLIAPTPTEPSQTDGWSELGLDPLADDLCLHLCSLNASKVSSDGAKAVGAARGIKCLHPQRPQAQPIKNRVCVQTSAFLASAISAIMASKREAAAGKSRGGSFFPILARIVTRRSMWP